MNNEGARAGAGTAAGTAARSLRLEANGLSQHVLVWGDESAPATAVLVHGYMDAAGTWDQVAPLLADAGLRVIAPDMRGFGEGPRVAPGGYYHFPDYVADLAAIIDALAPRGPLFLVGHSMGGTIVTLYSGARPGRPTRLAVLEGLGPPDMPPSMGPERMERWLEQLEAQRSRPARTRFPRSEAQRRLAMNHPNVASDVLATRVGHLVNDEGNGEVSWRFDPLHKTTSPMPFSSAVFAAFARRVSCPTLFVSGGPLGYHPPDEDARVSAFANVERAAIDGAGHMMHWTRPRELTTVLLAFWQKAEKQA